MRTASHDRSIMFLTEPPPEMKDPIGKWFCNDCDQWATECDDVNADHVWVIKWSEDEADSSA